MTSNNLLVLVAAVYLALLAAVASAYPHAPALPRRSASPCTYTCPPADALGFTAATNSNDGTTLFCSYPAFEGENPNDFFCTYSAVSGIVFGSSIAPPPPSRPRLT